MAEWQKISGKEVYRNAFYTVEEDKVLRPDGKEGTYSVVRKGPFCTVLAIDALQRVYFIRQFRYPTQRYGWELIKGGNDGQGPIEAGQRELQEEAGLTAKIWKEVGVHVPASSFCDEEGYILVAIDLEQAASHMQDEEGIVDCQAFSKEEYEAMIRGGEIDDGISIAALYHAHIAGLLD